MWKLLLGLEIVLSQGFISNASPLQKSKTYKVLITLWKLKLVAIDCRQE